MNIVNNNYVYYYFIFRIFLYMCVSQTQRNDNLRFHSCTDKLSSLQFSEANLEMMYRIEQTGLFVDNHPFFKERTFIQPVFILSIADNIYQCLLSG